MGKQILYTDDARKKILHGVERLADAVRVTMGPSGKSVILEKTFGSPVFCNDGATVAKEVELPDPFENMGARLVNQVAQKTSDVAGDGTSAATVLTCAIYREGLRSLTLGSNPMLVKRGIDLAVERVVDELQKLKKDVKTRKEIAEVATISANNDPKVGDMIAECMEKVGKDGVIQVEEGKALETTREFVDGLQFDKGYVSPYFITNPQGMEAVLEKPLILLYDRKLSSLRELIPILERVAQAGKPLLVIAEEVEGEALTALVVNKLRGVLPSCAVKAPGFGDRRKAMLEDMAILTGGRLLSEDVGVKIENLTLDDLGKAEKVVVKKEACTIVQGGGDRKKIEARIGQIKAQIEQTTSDYDREKLEERLAKLAGGVAIVKVGAATEAALAERKGLVEDAVHATRAAVEEGVVPGGGVALLRCRAALDSVKLKGDEAIGVEIVRRAVEAPCRQVAENAGRDGSVVVAEILDRSGSFGFNAATGEYMDLVKAGIVDPLKVVRTSLQNAASMAGLLLTTEVAVTELKGGKEKKVESAIA